MYSDRIAAVVNGDVILESDIEKHKRPIIRNLTYLPLGVVPPGKWPTEKEILDELIVKRLLEQEAHRRGIKIPEDAVTRLVQQKRKSNNLSHDQFVLFLAFNGVQYTDYLDMMRRQIKLNSLLSAEVHDKVPLSEEDAQHYFKDHKDTLEDEYRELVERLAPPEPPKPKEVEPDFPTHREIYVGGTVRIRRIVLTIPPDASRAERTRVEAKARKIMKDARMGADFAKLAKQYSDGPLAASGGDLGYVRYRDLRKNMQELVKSMKKGDVQGPAVTPNGILIFFLADAKGRKTKKVPIPKRVRDQWLKEWKKAQKEKQEAMRKKPPPRNPNKPKGDAAADEPDLKDVKVKDLGILTPEEEKEYAKWREKIIRMLRHKKSNERLKEWIEKLKKNSIIEVKL